MSGHDAGTVVLVGVAVCMVVAYAALCFAFRGSASRTRPSSGHTAFGLLVFLFFFLFGLWRSASAWRDVSADYPEGEQLFRAVLTDVPRVSERSVTADALSYVSRTDGARRFRKVSLTFARDSLSEKLGVGTPLVFRAQVRRPHNRGNPEEFDYARYLAVKGVSGQVYLPAGRWRADASPCNALTDLPLWAGLRIRALVWRDRLLSLYRQVGMQGEEHALLSAVTLGDKSALSRDLRNLYAETGVSHILALSGMHLGYLMIVFNFLFARCGRRRALQVSVGLSALFLMWTYVFVAGLPSSLVRAASMYTLMWGAVMCGRKGVSVHALLVSAFFMLCVNPMYLYDVGFQLSFLAMTGILTVYPACRKWRAARWPWVGWVVRSLWLSFSAQLFTLPLAGYYFGTVSVYSAGLTLLVSPLIALLLFAMPLLLAAEWGSCALASLLSEGVGQIIRLQNGLLARAACLPLASVEVDWPLLPVLSGYVLLVVLLMRRHMAYPRWLKSVLCLSLLLAVVWTVERRRHAVKPCIVFYNNPSCPAVHVIESARRSYLFPVHPDRVHERFAHVERAFWRRKLSEPPVHVTEDCREGRLRFVSGWAQVKGGPSFLMLHDGRWNGVSGAACTDVDYLYLCRGYKGDLKELSRLVRPRCVVLDASLRAGERERHIGTCMALGWHFHDMETKGALKVALK